MKAMKRLLRLVLAMAVLAVLVVPVPASPVGADEPLPDKVRISSSTSTTDSITVNWTEPNMNGAAICCYIVSHRVKGQGDDSWQDSQQIIPLTRSWTISGLESGTAYEIAVGFQVGAKHWRTGWIHDASTLADTPPPAPAATPTATPTPAPAATVELVFKAHDFKWGIIDGEEIAVLLNSEWRMPESRGQGGWFDFAAKMSPAPSADTEFTLEIAGYGDSPATRDDDYEIAPAGAITFTVPAGKSESEVKKVRFRPRCDNSREPDETLSLRDRKSVV